MTYQQVPPWAIFANFPQMVESKPMGTYRSRGEAEADAAKLRRWIGSTVLIRVVSMHESTVL